MRDLQSLEMILRNPDSKPHFAEAVKAYQAGAYRASIVETWVAVAVDLTAKLRHLSDGDSEARQLMEKFDKAIEDNLFRELQDFESNLLKNCRDFNLLTRRESEELNRLQKDRNLCAHPAYITPGDIFTPSAELVRHYLAGAVDCALSLPPTPGKSAIRILHDTIGSTAWPSGEHLTIYLRETHLTRNRESTKKSVVKCVVGWAISPENDTPEGVGENKFAHRARLALNAIYQIDPRLLTDAVRDFLLSRGDRLDAHSIARLIGSLGYLSEFWNLVSEAMMGQVIAVAKGADVNDLFEDRFFSSGCPSQATVAEIYNESFSRLIEDPEMIQRLMKTMTHGRNQLVAPAVGQLSTAGSFRRAEAALSTVLDLAGYLSVTDVRHVCEAVEANNQLHGAGGVPELLVDLYNRVRSNPDAATLMSGLANRMQDSHRQSPQGWHQDFQPLVDATTSPI